MEYGILGPLSVSRGGRELRLGGARQRSLLAVLLLRANELVPTARIVDELWGERPPATAVKAVQVQVSKLRKLLDEGALETRPTGYLLRVESGALDLDRFERLLDQGRERLEQGDAGEAGGLLREALGLWRGSPLAEFEYEAFARNEIGRLEELRLAALELRLDADLALARHTEVVGELEGLVRDHPQRESFTTLLMLALYRAGRQADALAAYQQTRTRLRDEFGLDPSEALQQLEKQILRHDASLELRADPVPGARSGLPVPATSFLGRELELRDVVELLQRDDVRLLTLTGPGGTGKTRLALQACAEAAEGFPDGLVWVALAPLRDPALVLAAVAQALGLQVEPGRPLADIVVDSLAGKRQLLLLDNAEHLLPEAVADIGRLLQAPAVTLLVTSRERLQLQGERVWAVPPLVPGDGVALFAARAGALGEEPLVSPPIVRSLCERLDNLPLAIELAAARTTLFTPEQLLERLAQRLDLLKAGRDSDPRQQTLRATIDWSYDLLAEGERQLFRRLAVFVGGCTYEAAEAVCEADPDSLQSLLDKSLLRRREAGLGPRFWMLETIHDYADEQLEAAGEAGELRGRHADYHLARLEERQPLILGSGRREQLAWFGEEEGNLRATLDYLEAAAPPDAARATDLLMWFWGPRGRLVEAQKRLLRLLARTDLVAGTRAMLLERLADAELRLGQLDSAESHAQDAVALAQESGERRTLAWALRDIASIASHRGDFDEAIRVLSGVLEEAADDEWLRSIALGDLAAFQMDAGRDEEARRLFQEAAKGLRASGDEANEAITSMCLAYLELYVRDFEAAYVVAAATLEKVRAIGDLYRSIGAQMVLGFAALGLGRQNEAREAFAESLDLVLAADTRSDALPETLIGIALAADATDARSAAKLQGAVNKLDEPVTRSPRFLQLERYLGQPLIDALGADEYANEQALGARMDIDETIDLARTLTSRTVPAAPWSKRDQ